MALTFVNERDTLGIARLLKHGGIPTEQWGTLIPQMAEKLEQVRFNRQPDAYKRAYNATINADPFTSAMMGTLQSLTGKAMSTLVRGAAPRTKLGHATDAIGDALASGKAEPTTETGKFFQRTLPSLIPDIPVFAALGATLKHPAAVLGAYSAANQAFDIAEGRQKTFDLKSLAKSLLLGGVFQGMGKVIGHIPYLKALEVPAGGALMRVGKGVARAGLQALPASAVSPTIELFDPTTNEKWDPKDFAHTWALFTTLSAFSLIKAGKFGALETRLKQEGMTPKQATILSNLAQTNPTATVHQMFGALMKNKAGIKNAANVWKAWQVKAGMRPPFGMSEIEQKLGFPMRTAVEEKARLEAMPVPSPKERLISTLELKAASPKTHPRRVAWYGGIAEKLKAYEGDITKWDKEEIRKFVGTKKIGITVNWVAKAIARIEKGKGAAVPLPPPERQFGVPTLAEYPTPSNRYIYTLGLQDILGPSVKAKMQLLLERAHLIRWSHTAEENYLKAANVSMGEKAVSRVRNLPTKAHVQMAKWLNTPHLNPKDIPPELREYYTQLRWLSDTLRERANVVREFVGLEPIPYHHGYMRYIYDLHSKLAIREAHPFPPELEYWISKVPLKHIFNPTALPRKGTGEGVLMDPFKAFRAMASTDLKQIYLEVPNLLFKEQIDLLSKKGVLPAMTRRWAEDFMNVVIKGYPSEIDKIADATLASWKIPQIMNAILKPVGRTWGPRSIANISNNVGRLIHFGTVWGRMKLVTRDFTQKFLGLGLYDSGDYVRALGPTPPEAARWIKESDFFNVSRMTFMEALPKGAYGKLEEIGYLPYDRLQVNNLTHTARMSYFATGKWAKSSDPNIRNFWSNPLNRKAEMDFGMDTCQYWYNAMGVPEVYHHKLASMFVKLQSWPMNYAFKYWREMGHRLTTGRPAWAGEGPSVLPMSARMGALRHIISSVVIIEGLRRGIGLDYRSIALLGVLPSYLSPAGQVAVGLTQLATAESDWERKEGLRKLQNSWKAFLPMSGAWQDVAKVWSGEKPVEFLFFHMAKE